MKLRRTLAIMLALVLCLSAAPFTASAETAEPYTIKYLPHGTIGKHDLLPDRQLVQDTINEWLAANGCADIKLDMMNLRDVNTIQVQLAAQDKIDIFFSNSAVLTDELIASNCMYNLVDLYTQYEGLYNSMPQNIWNSVLRDAGTALWQIPVYKESAVGYSYVIKKYDADRFGWTDIIANDPARMWTIQDLAPYLEEAMATGDYEQGLYPGTNYACWNQACALLDKIAAVNNFIAIDLEGDTTKAVLATEIPAYREYVETMTAYNEAGYVYADILTEFEKSRDIDWLFYAETTTPDFQANMDARYAGYPDNELDKYNGVYYLTMTNNYLTSNSALGAAYSIASYTENVDACMRFLDALYSKQELADLLQYGIEGLHYNRISEDVVETIADAGYSASGWATCNMMAPSIPSTASADKKQQYADFNASAVDHLLLGFVFDESKVSAEVAACTAVLQEYSRPLEWGFMGETGLDDYASALYAAGAQTIIDEAQTQLNAFFAAKN